MNIYSSAFLLIAQLASPPIGGSQRRAMKFKVPTKFNQGTSAGK